MAKRKDSKALFEVIARGKDNRSEPGMAVPQWLQKQPQDAPAPSGGEDESSQPPVDQAPPEPGMLPTPRMDETSAAEPLMSSAGGRVRISLNYASFAAAVLGAVVVLGGAFWLGRITSHGRGEAPTEKTMADNLPVRPGVVEASSTPATKAKYYLVIERMLPGLTPENKADAEAVVKYLDTKGIHARVSEANRGQLYVVMSTDPGFADPKSTEATKFAEDIEDMGKAYRPPPGRKKYSFIQHNKDGLNPSYIPLH